MNKNYLYDALKMEESQTLSTLATFDSNSTNHHYYRGRLDLTRHLLSLLEYQAEADSSQE